ncbi:hypothetical protein MNBD_ALPHA08-2086 [hydrothermal vent metagenome]|uniref:Protein SlyX homolog n=1 Tax=hydrothermal vent metagenome TaxID=652676 RepID=A0A3B0R8N1_9ZZZZ
MSETRITELEVQLAHQSATVDELNDMVAKQWQEIDWLKKQLTRLTGRLEQVEQTLPKGPADDQPPPHY